MDAERNFANMERTLSGEDGQSLQHFMSNSPWSGPEVFQQIQREIKASQVPTQGSTLILDESADEKAGTHNAGASRQYNGRMGKVDLCRVDTCLFYANANLGLWTMVDGELFLPEEWFGEDFAQRRKELGIPEPRQFETKSQLGLKMVKRAKANGLPFELLACDTFYGRDSQLRADLAAQGVLYAAQVPGIPEYTSRNPRWESREDGASEAVGPPGQRCAGAINQWKCEPWPNVPGPSGIRFKYVIPNGGCCKRSSP